MELPLRGPLHTHATVVAAATGSTTEERVPLCLQGQDSQWRPQTSVVFSPLVKEKRQFFRLQPHLPFHQLVEDSNDEAVKVLYLGHHLDTAAAH